MHPSLEDDRVAILKLDIAQILQVEHRAYDAILLDVDNGPRGLTRKSNYWLPRPDWMQPLRHCSLQTFSPYGRQTPDRAFAQLLRKAGFEVDEKRVRARGSRRGGYHTIWIAERVVQPSGALTG